MNNMQILCKVDRNLTTIILEVTRVSKNKKIENGCNLCNDLEREIRNLLENNFKKDNRYNPKKEWIFGNRSDRITLECVPEGTGFRLKEIHYHVYQGAKEKLDEILTYCKDHDINFKEGIGSNLKEKYGKMHYKNIKNLLKL